MEDDDRPMVDRQGSEGALELVAVRQVVGGVGDGRLELEDPDLRLETVPASELLGDRVEEQLPDPRLELGGVAEAGQVAPTADERLLDRVLRDICVLRDEPGDRVEPVDHVEHEHVERIAVAVSCLFDQIESHANLACGERCSQTLRRDEMRAGSNLPFAWVRPLKGG